MPLKHNEIYCISEVFFPQVSKFAKICHHISISHFYQIKKFQRIANNTKHRVTSIVFCAIWKWLCKKKKNWITQSLYKPWSGSKNIVFLYICMLQLYISSWPVKKINKGNIHWVQTHAGMVSFSKNICVHFNPFYLLLCIFLAFWYFIFSIFIQDSVSNQVCCILLCICHSCTVLK